MAIVKSESESKEPRRISSIGGLTLSTLGAAYIAINTGALLFAQTLAEKAHHLSPETIPMVSEYYFNKSGIYRTVEQAEVARKIVEDICWEVGFWAPISCCFLLGTILILFWRVLNLSISISHLLLLEAGGIISFLAIAYFTSAITALPELLFESY